MARRQLIVTGKVQGVGFRWFVRENARRAGLAGWVQNLPDGSVEIAVDGDEAAVDALERAVNTGPTGARVESVARIANDAEPLTTPFSVRRHPRAD